jgi:hypothetical protein
MFLSSWFIYLCSLQCFTTWMWYSLEPCSFHTSKYINKKLPPQIHIIIHKHYLTHNIELNILGPKYQTNISYPKYSTKFNIQTHDDLHNYKLLVLHFFTYSTENFTNIVYVKNCYQKNLISVWITSQINKVIFKDWSKRAWIWC